VKLQILSERVVRTGWCADNTGEDNGSGDEKLVVRWRTESKSPEDSGQAKTSTPSTSPVSASSAADPTNRGLSSLLGGDQPLLRLPKDPAPSSFSGLFIFGFDDEGKIVSHTIEHADESNGWDKMARVVTLTDWLLGKAKGSKSKEEMELGLAYAGEWEGWDRQVQGGGVLWEERR